MTALKVCPLCASPDTIINGSTASYAQCRSCGAEGPVKDTDDEASFAWNRRAPSPAVVGLVEALKPFAAAAEWDWDATVWQGMRPEQAQILYCSATKAEITLADLHAARAALSAETP